MTNGKAHLVASLLLVALATIAGCQSGPGKPSYGVEIPEMNLHIPTSKPVKPSTPGNEGYYRPRNPYFLPKPILAMESDELRDLAAKPGEQPGYRELAWYDARNDARMSVQSGYRSTTFETSSTYTYDRQYQHGGSVRDHYSRTTRTGSITETAR